MTSPINEVSLKGLRRSWDNIIPDCGVTLRRTLNDPMYYLNWSCLYNSKRMQRRYLPRQQLDTCAFCVAAKSEDYKLGQLDSLAIYGNKYPIEPMHIVLFNGFHKEDPGIEEFRSIIKLSQLIPELKILLSNRHGSGASIPAHMHIHAFLMDLPIEHAKIKSKIVIDGFEICELSYPAWTLKINYLDNVKMARLLIYIIDHYKIPFNIDFINKTIYILPRRIESPHICENKVDGVGSLETAGVYTVIDEESLKEITLETFHQGLTEASFQDDIRFQKKFINFCKDAVKKL